MYLTPLNNRCVTKGKCDEVPALENLVKHICDMSPAEIDQYFQNNVTDLASAREHLRKLTHLVARLVWIHEVEQRSQYGNNPGGVVDDPDEIQTAPP